MYEFEKHTAELIEIAARMRFPKDATMYCDSAEPDRIKEWSLAGWRATKVDKGPGSVKGQIDYLKQKMIHVDPQCVNTYKEIQQWRWLKDGNGVLIDKPLEVEDDAMAALRYSIEPFRMSKRMRVMDKRSLGIR
jgi:phage terminase large subunit